MVVAGYCGWDVWRDLSGIRRASGMGHATAERNALHARVIALGSGIAALRAEADKLRAHNTALQRDFHAARSGKQGRQANPLYRRVGLDEDAPERVIHAVRRAYRAKLHPDRHRPRVREDAERRFKETESIFDRIDAVRR